MPTAGQIDRLASEAITWRHHLHRHPELRFDVVGTAEFVRGKLESFGCDQVLTGLAGTGVVALIEGRGKGPVIGLRADMDALPIEEGTAKPYASRRPGQMHACGHDGHMAMLLGAAKFLAANRDFGGTAAFIFQPAEESGCGARVMVEDGLMPRFSIAKVFGMHNLPGLPIGRFALRAGPIMAATAVFTIRLKGRGGHAAMPQQVHDPIVACAQLIMALQTIVSRRVDPLDAAVLSVTRLQAGESQNVIPDVVELAGTVRTLRDEVDMEVERRVRQLCAGVAASSDVAIELDYTVTCPATVNDVSETETAARAARRVGGEAKVRTDLPPMMIGEDFAFMLRERPGAFIFIGNGDSAGLHQSNYDFDDRAIAHGISYWINLLSSNGGRRPA